MEEFPSFFLSFSFEPYSLQGSSNIDVKSITL